MRRDRGLLAALLDYFEVDLPYPTLGDRAGASPEGVPVDAALGAIARSTPREHESVDVPFVDLYIGGAPSRYQEVTGKNPLDVDLGKDRLVFRA